MAVATLISLLPACEKLEPQPRRVPDPNFDPAPWGCLGCGGGAGGGGGTTSTPIYISIYDNKFNPDTVTITKGLSIVWLNRDNYIHDLISSHDTAFKSGNIRISGDFIYMTKNIDTLRYYCTVHNEKGIVIITP